MCHEKNIKHPRSLLRHAVPMNANPSLPEGDALALRSEATMFLRFPPDRPRKSEDLP